jgi:hypothetical protein
VCIVFSGYGELPDELQLNIHNVLLSLPTPTCLGQKAMLLLNVLLSFRIPP